MNVYLVRHTAVAVPAGTCYGRSDVPLADTFAEEVTALKLKLPASFAAVYSSPLGRCTQFAHQFTPSPKLDHRLQEYDFGDWEMMAWENIRGEEADRWFADYVHAPPPNGESYLNLQERVISFWHDLSATAQQGDEPHLIITHAGPIRALLAHLLQAPLATSFNLTINYGAVTLLQVNQTHTQIRYINR